MGRRDRVDGVQQLPARGDHHLGARRPRPLRAMPCPYTPSRTEPVPEHGSARISIASKLGGWVVVGGGRVCASVRAYVCACVRAWPPGPLVPFSSLSPRPSAPTRSLPPSETTLSAFPPYSAPLSPFGVRPRSSGWPAATCQLRMTAFTPSPPCTCHAGGQQGLFLLPGRPRLREFGQVRAHSPPSRYGSKLPTFSVCHPPPLFRGATRCRILPPRPSVLEKRAPAGSLRRDGLVQRLDRPVARASMVA